MVQRMKRIVAAMAVIGAVSSAVWAGETAGSNGSPTFRKIQLTDKFYAEGSSFGDFNRDGKKDVVVGPYWYEGPEFKTTHEIFPPKAYDPHGYSDDFLTFVADVNGDGWDDVIVIGWPGKGARWYQNPQGKPGGWTRHAIAAKVDNESPVVTDLLHDGNPVLVCSVNGRFGYYRHDAKDPAKLWTFHPTSGLGATGGQYTHGLGVGDINGDGRLDLLEKSGWWEQPASLAGDPVWTKHPHEFSQHGGSQMFAYDVNGDGHADVITSENAHGYGLGWFEQIQTLGKIDFKKHLIMGTTPAENRYGVKFSQLHSMALADVNGDGLLDIITGKRFWAHGPTGDVEPGAPAVLYWFELRRRPGGAEYVPHLIDNNSGVGTQVTAGDLNGDGAVDIVVGNKKGAFVFIHQIRHR